MPSSADETKAFEVRLRPVLEYQIGTWVSMSRICNYVGSACWRILPLKGPKLVYVKPSEEGKATALADRADLAAKDPPVGPQGRLVEADLQPGVPGIASNGA
jgi:hypothetical protein